jgi:hypothetical protein
MEEHGVIVDGIVLARVDTEKHAKLGLDDQFAYHLGPNDYYRHSVPAAAGRLSVAVQARDGEAG